MLGKFPYNNNNIIWLARRGCTASASCKCMETLTECIPHF